MMTAGQQIVAAWRKDDNATWQSLADAIDAQLRDTIDSERAMAVSHAEGSVSLAEVRTRLRADLEYWRVHRRTK